jgi:hypothetical protein
MLALPDEYFAKLRLHTHHLTGDHHWSYMMSGAAFARATGLQELTEGIPPDLVLDEPAGGMGIMLDNSRFVSTDSIRFQRVVNTLYRESILDALRQPAGASRLSILEIGAGYGGLAHHLSNILGNTTYVIVDLPEVLLFSAAYLTLFNETKTLYLYNQADFSPFIDSSEAKLYDFILIPNYRLEALRRWTFDFALNMDSFQEMSEEQVAFYLDFIRDTCKGVLYSKNRESYNRELSSLTELLMLRFAMHTVTSSLYAPPPQPVGIRLIRLKLRRALKSMVISVGMLDRLRQWGIAPPLTPYTGPREYICTPLQPSPPAQAGTYTKRDG